MDTLKQRNELRMKVWEIDIEITQMMQIPKAYRSYDKIEKLQEQRSQIENQINEMQLAG